MIEYLQGEPVLIEAKDFFLGKKLGWFYMKCPDHENSYKVQLVDPEASIGLVCVHVDKGDTIVIASKWRELDKDAQSW